ncbi:hypothetical protein [Corynebacterium sp. HMSC076C10]|uniref:hypothetical protein n=1 Tax=Corynebacterium sp. HMSC076C10 TaxID=1739361 RepID=UPI001FEE6171|nr:MULTISPECIES: hypothetical protein [Corynebacterium]MDK8506637.1 hypothetical protein [Corynebacterium amycolatum]
MSDTNGDMSMASAGELVMFRTDDGATRIEVRLVDETVWLTQAQMVELFQSSKANVSEHIRNVFAEGELPRSEATVRKFRTVQLEGSREVSREREHYNLDVIISVGGKSLEGAGTVSHRQAVQKAHAEYEKYKTVMDTHPVAWSGTTSRKSLQFRNRFSNHRRSRSEPDRKAHRGTLPEWCGVQAFGGNFQNPKWLHPVEI